MAVEPRERDPHEHGGAPERVSIVVGDRLCVRCGFNLHGQTIVREPHYRMLAVRCPECSTMASLQEYPVLGRWAARIGLFLAAWWAFGVLVLALLTGLTLYGSSVGIGTTATTPAAEQIGRAFQQYVTTNETMMPSGNTYSVENAWMVQQGEPRFYFIDPDWLDGQDVSEFAATRVDGRTLVAALPVLLAAFAWGVVWSVVLLHRRMRRQLPLLGLIAAGCAAWLLATHTGTPQAPSGFGPFAGGWGWLLASDVAQHLYGLPAALVGLALCTGAAVLGLSLGRRIARAIVRLLLPPHLRGSLAMLWHVDGLPSPPTRSEFWIRG